MTQSQAEPSPYRLEQIGAVLESVVRLSRSLATPRSTPFGDAVLTRTQLEVLFVLAHAERPVAPGQLAATLKVTPGAITQTVEQLRDLGLVEQSVSNRDARARVLGLTPIARSQVESFEAAAVLRAGSWFDGLSDEALASLASAIAHVKEP
ncbi:MAG: MarR family winged helix-turn-helix transcriptional regulator [Microbacterium sp.]